MERPTVLVIDDVEAIVEELLTLMALHKIPAAGANDLDSAIITLTAEPTIRAISCDIRLDEESGLDLMTRIEECKALHDRKFSFLFVTGDQMQLDRLSSTSDLAILSKPVQPRVLVEAVQRMLSPADA
jgi:DNA-binding NtrC family response regulator